MHPQKPPFENEMRMGKTTRGTSKHQIIIRLNILERKDVSRNVHNWAPSADFKHKSRGKIQISVISVQGLRQTNLFWRCVVDKVYKLCSQLFAELFKCALGWHLLINRVYKEQWRPKDTLFCIEDFMSQITSKCKFDTWCSKFECKKSTFDFFNFF